VSVLQFLAIPWFFTVLLLYVTVVEYRNDNPRDAGLLGVISVFLFLCSVVATLFIWTSGMGWHDEIPLQIS
jgi:hypothetical protein